jgi:hypothetical protein
MPFLTQMTQLQAVTNGYNGLPGTNVLQQPTAVSSTIGVGGIQAIAAASGTPLALGTTFNNTTSYNTSNTIPLSYLTGKSRVVGMGMEIVNTTAVLIDQGLVTTGRIPVPTWQQPGTFVIFAETTSLVGGVGSAAGVYLPTPPATIATASLYAGTKAWKATQGSYQPAPFNTDNLPACGTSFVQPIFYASSPTDASVYMSKFQLVTGNITTGTVVAGVPPVYWTNTDMPFSFFTGLAAGATVTANLIVYLERFPDLSDLDLIVSATRSPAYDPKAIEAYSMIMQSMPAAVTFAENGDGGLFDSVVSGFRAIAPIIGMIPHPAARAASIGIQAAGALKDAFDQPPSSVAAGNDIRGVDRAELATRVQQRRVRQTRQAVSRAQRAPLLQQIRSQALPSVKLPRKLKRRAETAAEDAIIERVLTSKARRR